VRPDLLTRLQARTKGVSRSGGIEGVWLSDEVVVRGLCKCAGRFMPGDALLQRTAAQFRKCFVAASADCEADEGVSPYSLRRGGATWCFRLHGSMGRRMELGVWSHLKTARVYVNTAFAELTVLQQIPAVVGMMHDIGPGRGVAGSFV